MAAALNESAALDVVAVRAVETADTARELCSDADRAWASHAAAADVGESAPPGQFLARRAQLLLARLSERHRVLARTVAALRWRAWIGYLLLLAAFLGGLLVDRLAHDGQINVLAPPMLLFVAWNLLVYLLLLAGALSSRGGSHRGSGPLRRLVMLLGSHQWQLRDRGQGELAAAIPALAADWARLSQAIFSARAARLLHLAAAVWALGMVGGMYVRGLALEYRASWQSTFLEPTAVHAVLAAVLAPGAWLAGMAVPDAAQVAAIRAPASENAAQWLHLFASSLLVLVIVPRVVLASLAYWQERRRARGVPIELSQPYFQRLMRGFHVAPTTVRVVPYGYTPTAPAHEGLRTLLGRLLGGDAEVDVGATVAYGADEDALAPGLANPDGPTVVVFNLASTPEQEAHCAFAAALARRLAPGQNLLVLVDETSFRARSGDDARRLEERRGLWRDQLAHHGLVPAFAALADAGQVVVDDATLEAALVRGRA